MSFKAMLWKDLHRELRSRDAFLAGAVTVLVFLLLDLFSFGEASSHQLVAFLLWMPLVYGAIAAVGRGMSQEADKGTLDWLLSLPVQPLAIAASRTLVDTGLIVLLGACGVIGIWALYGVSITVALLATLLLAALGLGIVGSMVGAIAAHGKQRESLLPMLMIPVLAPLLHSGLAATRTVLASGNLASNDGLIIMAGFDLVMVGAAVILWPFLLEEA